MYPLFLFHSYKVCGSEIAVFLCSFFFPSSLDFSNRKLKAEHIFLDIRPAVSCVGAKHIILHKMDKKLYDI
jgi:hypothetical protein